MQVMTEGALREPIRPSVVRALLGLAAWPTAIILAAPAIFALGAGDLPFATRGGTAAAFFLLIAWICRGARPSGVRRSEARVAATLLYLLVPLGMTLPLATHPRLDLRGALFESISAFTTTGLSVMDADGAAPALLFARSWLAWIGGLTAVALAVSVLLPPGASVDLSPQAMPSLRGRLRRIGTAYLALTALTTLALMTAGLPALRALLHAFSAVSTGGMAPDPRGLTDLIPAARIAILCGALLGSVPLIWLSGAADADERRLARWQGLAGLGVLGFATVFVAASMNHFGAFESGATRWDAASLAVSAQTTLGLAPLPPNSLDPSSKLAMCVTMACGGAFGSTTGGMKLLRLLILIAAIRRFVVRSALRRDAVLDLRVAGVRFDEEAVRRVLLVVVLFFVTVLLSWLPFVFAAKDPLDALVTVVAATSNCAFSTGAPLAELSPRLQALLMADMLLGRLEFLAVLLVLYPGTWIGDWRSRAIAALEPGAR